MDDRRALASCLAPLMETICDLVTAPIPLRRPA
jgi:hypothetical protein